MNNSLILFKLTTLLALITLLTACRQAEPDPRFEIYLCLGQSNMVGMQHAEAEDSVVSPRFLSLPATEGPDRQMGEWRLALPPLCSPRSGVSPLHSFGETMLQHLPQDHRLGVIVVAVNGCSIRLFDPDQSQAYIASVTERWMQREIACFGYNPYQRLVTLARQAQRQGVIRGILVHQGETDAEGDVWIRNLEHVYHCLLDDLGLDADQVPLLVGEAVASDQLGTYQHVNTVIDRVHDVIPTAHVISSHGCEPMPDHLHFSRVGARLLGQRYALRALQLRGYPLPDDPEAVLQSAAASPLDAFVVNVSVRPSDSLLFVSSAVPLASVDVTSFSGDLLAHLQVGGGQLAEFPLSSFAGEQRLSIIATATSGAVVSQHYDCPGN